MSATEGSGTETISLEEIGEVLAFIDTLDLAEVDLTIGDVRVVVRKRGSGSRIGTDASLREATEPIAQHDEQSEPLIDRVSEPELDEKPPSRPATTDAADEALATWLAKEEAGEVTIVRSPMVGTFYRAKEPGAPPFVEPGAEVDPDDVICLVEVMKLFHSVTAGASGIVDAVLVSDGAVVEHAQPLMVLARR